METTTATTTTTEPTSTERRVQRVRHELRVRPVRVVDVQRDAPDLAPDFVRVTFAGDALRDFPSASFDDHVKFIFRTPAGEELRRDFTPRRFDTQAGTVVIEYALHEHGPASDWARQVQVGDEAVIGGPRGSMIVPVDYDWHLLAGDASALPAILRRLEELPPGAQAVAVLLTPEPLDRATLTTRATLTLRQAPTLPAWLACLAALPTPPGSGFAWCAGEAGAMARVRQLWLEERGLAREHTKIAAYWKQGAADFHE